MALAIASFVLLAIFALIYVSQESSKASSDDTRLSQISQQVFHQVQIDLATQAAFTTPPSPWTQVVGTTTVPPSYQYNYYFDGQGSPLASATTPAAAISAGAIYQATAVVGPIMPPANWPANSPYPPNTDSTILKGLVITINWPPAAWTSTTGPSRTYSLLLRNRGSYGNSPIDTPPYP